MAAAVSSSFGNAPGTVLENLSSRKFYVLLISLFLILLACFSIGAFISPKPATVLNTLFSPCLVSSSDFEEGKLFYRFNGSTGLNDTCKVMEEYHMKQVCLFSTSCVTQLI